MSSSPVLMVRADLVDRVQQGVPVHRLAKRSDVFGIVHPFSGTGIADSTITGISARVGSRTCARRNVRPSMTGIIKSAGWHPRAGRVADRGRLGRSPRRPPCSLLLRGASPSACALPRRRARRGCGVRRPSRVRFAEEVIAATCATATPLTSNAATVRDAEGD